MPFLTRELIKSVVKLTPTAAARRGQSVSLRAQSRRGQSAGILTVLGEEEESGALGGGRSTKRKAAARALLG